MFDCLFKSNKNLPIGLDIGHSQIKMIQLSGRDGVFGVEAAEELALDRTLEFNGPEWRQKVIEAIGTMYRNGGFTGSQVISCLPSDLLKIKSLRLETGDLDRIDSVIRDEVAQRFELDADQDEIRYMVAGNVYQGESIKNEVIFFGISREHLAGHIELLEEAHLTPVSIDTVPCALFRSFRNTLRRREDQELVSVFVDLGARYTTVVIGKGQEIVFVKQIPIAGDQLNEQVASSLGINLDEAAQLRQRMHDTNPDRIAPETRRAVVDAMTNSIENLAHEISLCFKYYAVTFRGQRPAEAVFAGGEAYESALMDSLRRHLGVKIQIAEPLRGYDLTRANFNRRRNPQMCEWATAIGLVLKGIQMDTTRKQAVMAGSV